MKNIKIILSLFILFNSLTVWASNTTQMPIKVNVDATVSLTPVDGSGGAEEFSVDANIEKVLNFTYYSTNSSADYTLQVISQDEFYADTTLTITVNMWYTNVKTITLNEKQLPTDTAYLPVRTNINAKLIATPLEMIQGGTPGSFEYDLNANEYLTLHLPVETDLPISITKTFKQDQNILVSQINRKLDILLPTEYLGGEILLTSPNGRIIGKTSMTSSISNSVSIPNIASGIYFITIRKSSKYHFSHKVNLTSGNLLINTKFSNGYNNKRKQRTFTNNQTRSRATEARYRFEFQSKDSDYRDSTFELTLTGQQNRKQYIRLVDPSDTNGYTFEELVDSAFYEELFPHRYSKDPEYQPAGPDGDFYSYSAFRDAAEEMKKFKAIIYTKPGAGGDKVKVTYSDGSTHTYYSIGGYEDHLGTETSSNVDYADFLNEGAYEIILEELVAFLAHIASETTGGGDAMPDGRWAWGLLNIHETGMSESTTSSGYTVPNHSIYPSAANQSYHGRGPKQLSWNYNYGQFSDFVYKDGSVLVNNPNKVAQEGKLAFMAAIWFWMTPQGAKPSCHQVMAETWIPTQKDIDAGRTETKFGQTTNIINGGVECGGSFLPANSEKRVGHYRYFEDKVGIVGEDKCDCANLKNYNEVR